MPLITPTPVPPGPWASEGRDHRGQQLCGERDFSVACSKPVPPPPRLCGTRRLCPHPQQLCLQLAVVTAASDRVSSVAAGLWAPLSLGTGTWGPGGVRGPARGGPDTLSTAEFSGAQRRAGTSPQPHSSEVCRIQPAAFRSAPAAALPPFHLQPHRPAKWRVSSRAARPG